MVGFPVSEKNMETVNSGGFIQVIDSVYRVLAFKLSVQINPINPFNPISTKRGHGNFKLICRNVL